MFAKNYKWLLWLVVFCIGSLSPIQATQNKKIGLQKKPRKSKKFSLGTTKQRPLRPSYLDEDNAPDVRPLKVERRNSVILEEIEKNRQNQDDKLTVLGDIEKSTTNLSKQLNDTNNHLTNMSNVFNKNEEQQKRTENMFYSAMGEVKKYKKVVAFFAFMGSCALVMYIISMYQVAKKAEEIKVYGQETVRKATKYAQKTVQKAKRIAVGSIIYLCLFALIIAYFLLVLYRKKRQSKLKRR